MGARWVTEAARIIPALDDLRSAVQWAAHAPDAARADAALRVVGGLLWCWFVFGNFAEAIPLTETALRAAVAAGLAAGASPVWTPAPDASPTGRRTLAKAVASVAGLYTIANRLTEGVAAAENAVALSDAECAAGGRDVEAQRRLVYAPIPLAEAHLATGAVDRALAIGARNVADARILGGRDLAFALARRGHVLGVAGDHSAARAALEEGTALFAADGEIVMLANAEQTFAEHSIATGDLAGAAAHVRASLAAQRDAKTSWVCVRSLDLAAQLVVAGAVGEAPAGAAARLLGAAAAIRRRAAIEVIH